jgi:aspartyl-tRNA synthetase
MKHLSPTELTEKAGEAVILDGWLQTVRDQGGIVFLIIRNNQGSFQAVVLKGSGAYAASKGLTMESVIKVRGMAKLEQNAPYGVEVMVEELQVLSVADPELPIPVSESAENEAEQQKRLDWRWLDLRRTDKRLIFEAWTTMEQAARKYWTENGYLEIHSPKLMSIPSEGAAELFEVKYFERTAYLAQSPQLYKQMAMASGFERIFEVGPVFTT